MSLILISCFLLLRTENALKQVWSFIILNYITIPERNLGGILPGTLVDNVVFIHIKPKKFKFYFYK